MIFTPLIRAFNWLTKGFVSHIKDAAKIAVVITETVKTVLNNPITGFLVELANVITGTQLPSTVVADINAVIPKILAVELSIEGLPDNPTTEQIQAFEQAVLSAFKVNADNSKLLTTLGTQIYQIIQSKLADGKFTFAEGVDAVEQAWQDYQADLKLYPGIIDLPVGTKLPDGNIIVESASDALKETENPNQ